MKPNTSFLGQTEIFWSSVKLVSEILGYSQKGQPRRYSLAEVKDSLSSFKVNPITISRVHKYLNFRSRILESKIEKLLMNRDQSRQIFKRLTSNYKPKCHLPKNKQKGSKRHPAYFTCILNILIEKNYQGVVDDNPTKLSLVTDKNNKPAKVFSRWFDGAYPSTTNPKAVWEVKEYYGTTTFGSRVADGVYESQLDGYEIMQATRSTGRRIRHYLFVDDKFTWWVKGKSYLCRLVDMSHMGFVDEVIYGREILKRWPIIVRKW